jgi:hypothetical protein
MKKPCCALVLALVLAAAWPVAAGAQGMAEDEDLSQTTQEPLGYVPGAWSSLAAAASNIVYFPVRLAITLVTAEAGGLTGWLTGGDRAAARAVWHSTDGQAYITPEVIEGRERLRFGDYE